MPEDFSEVKLPPQEKNNYAWVAGIVVVLAIAVAGAITYFALPPKTETPFDLKSVTFEQVKIEKPSGAAKPSLLQMNSMPDSIGNTYFLARIKNEARVKMRRPKLEISLLGNGGEVLTVKSGVGMHDYLYPGQVTPVKVFVPNAPSYEKLKTAIIIEPPYFKRERPAIKLTSGALLRGTYSDYQINGRMKNMTNKEAHYIRVHATIYDSNSEIIAMKDHYTGKGSLKPGEEAVFDFMINTWGNYPAKILFDYDATQNK